MWRFAWRFLAAVSLVSLARPAAAESRPRYGGTLAVELHDTVTLTDPADWPLRMLPLVYDRLVRLDPEGRPQPALAVSWQHDASNRHWEFHLRPHAIFHNGFPLTAPTVAACLKDWLNVTALGDNVVVFQSDTSAPDLPVRLAGARGAIFMRGADGATAGTGPFRVAEWQPGKRALLAAFDGYWGGRPFVDSLEIRMGRTYREQAIDLELGKADLVEIPITDLRRAAQQSVRTWTAAPSELLALLFEPGPGPAGDAHLREAIALSIDRDAIHTVLLQSQGESTGAILPEWLTGYAFLFPASRALDRARQIAAALPKNALRVSLAYDPADPLERPIAERIALNAREAGISIQTAAGVSGALRLERFPLRSLDPAEALAEMGRRLHIDALPVPVTPEARVQYEHKLLGDYRLVPLFDLPAIYGLSSRVKNWDPQPWGDWRLDNVWLETRTP